MDDLLFRQFLTEYENSLPNPADPPPDDRPKGEPMLDPMRPVRPMPPPAPPPPPDDSLLEQATTHDAAIGSVIQALLSIASAESAERPVQASRRPDSPVPRRGEPQASRTGDDRRRRR